MLFLVISFFLLVLVLFGLKQRENVTILIDNKVNYALRGICALEILIGHVGTVVNEPSLIIYEKAMICCVGVFFMLSGYGLMQSFLTKDDYMKNFLKRRFTSLFIPIVECFIVYLIILKYQDNQTIYSIIKHYSFVEFINWYVIELIVMYIIFYILYTFLKKESSLKLLWAISIVSVVIMYFVQLHKCWYVSTLCFPLGIMIREKENVIIEFLKSKYWIKLFYSFIFFIGSLSCFLFDEKGFFLIVICRNWATFSFATLILVIITKLNIYNEVLCFLGRYSYSIYLYHIMLLYPLEFVLKQSGVLVYLIVLLGGSLLLGIGFDSINNYYKKIKKLCN